MTTLVYTIVAAAMTAPFAVSGTPATEAPALKEAKTLSVQRTRIKAKPGERENLEAYLIANWFEMDRKGVEKGIFTFYRLLENPEEERGWDFVVEVGYPNIDGYEDPKVQETFTAIREAHQEILIEGKKLRDLGSFVSNDRLILRYESE